MPEQPNKLLVDLCREWLNGSAKPVACGHGPDGPNVQIDRPNGEAALISLRPVAEALVDAYKNIGVEKNDV